MKAIAQEEVTTRTEETRPPRVPARWFVHGAWRVHRALYKLSSGRFLWTTSNKRGWGALHLTTVGRKSGQERSVIVGYVEDGPNLVLLAMNGWGEGHPSWWLNLEAHPGCRSAISGPGCPSSARASSRGRGACSTVAALGSCPTGAQRFRRSAFDRDTRDRPPARARDVTPARLAL